MTKPGIDADGVAENEADHFMKCPAYSQWFDMRDLARVVEVADTSHAKEKAARRRLFNSNLIICGLRGHPCRL
jgi:hypothetical protein